MAELGEKAMIGMAEQSENENTMNTQNTITINDKICIRSH